MDTFLTLLSKNAYENLDVTNASTDLHGWMCNEFTNVFETFIKKRNSSESVFIIEVGSWKGLSTNTMAKLCKQNNYHAKILAVDTWLGAPEFWTWGLHDPSRGESLKMSNGGYPQVFFTFTSNVKLLGNHDIIIPFPISSIQAADVLSYYKAQADCIYIDAAHEYNAVLMDLIAYWPFIKHGGMMFGDDYSASHWPGVVQAVNEFAKQNNLNVIVNGVVWSVVKS